MRPGHRRDTRTGVGHLRKPKKAISVITYLIMDRLSIERFYAKRMQATHGRALTKENVYRNVFLSTLGDRREVVIT